MKSLLKNSLILALVASFVALYSCKTEDPEPIVFDDPTMTVVINVNGDAATSPATVKVGDVISGDFGFDTPGNFNVLRVEIAVAGTVVKSLELPRTSITGDPDFTGFSLTGVVLDTIKTSYEEKDVVISFEVVDDQDKTGTAPDFTLDVEAGIVEFTAVLIGGFNSETLGSSYDAVEDSVYFASNLRNNAANQAKIDFVYYFADTPQRTIASPDNAEAQATWAAQNTSSWPFGNVENTTRFKPVAESFDYTATTTQTALANAYGEVGDELTRVTNLAVDQVYAFKLAESRGGKYGVFKVTAVEGNSSGSITLSVKIQK